MIVVSLVMLSVSILSVYGNVTPNYVNYELRYSFNTVSWGTAWATCQEHSQSDLVDIKDSVRNKALEHFFSTPEASAMYGPMWIGLHYVKSVAGGEFQWSDCQSVNETVPWLTDEPNNPEASSCITAGRRAFMTRTRNCSSNFVFVCQKINGDCSYTSFKDKICETKGRRVILEGQFSHGECRDRCSMDKNGSDLCWAFERDKSGKCTLIFSTSPYVCESQVSLKDTDSAARHCFEFSDITGTKETIVESNAPVSACVSTVTTSTVAAAAATEATTTAPPATTSITTTTSTTTETDPTQSSTSLTAGVESTHTETSTTTAITTLTATTELSAVTTASTSTASTSESAAVTTVATSASTAIPPNATTTASKTVTPTHIPVPSTTSTAALLRNVTGGALGALSPSLDTFLSRLEAALTNHRSAPISTVTSLGRQVYVVCVVVQTFTIAERKKRTDDMVSDLTLDKKNLSSYRRKKSSAEDERPSARSVGGGVAIILLVTTAIIIILPDCANILMYVMHVHKKKQLVPAQQQDSVLKETLCNSS
ncbi:uncharacterized protein [Haliotis asinina]|uniref:uncharacterized protein n=1 Tax=Haliotis asinina TaxID=109174 RepID=UPI003532679C